MMTQDKRAKGGRGRNGFVPCVPFCLLSPFDKKGINNMVRQAKLGRTNRMKGICTAKKTTCR